MTITTVLIDLDGVIRHFDPNHPAEIEADAGLGPGALTAAAFAPELLDPLVTGTMTRAEWVDRVGDAVGDATAASAWLAHGGEIDQSMITLIDELRRLGLTVAILTNGTDTIPAELDHLGVTPHVDAVFNSAEIGFAKPDRRAFEYVCSALAVSASEVFFTDDSEHKLAGAVEIGMTVHHFVDRLGLRRRLADLGIAPG